MSTSSRRRPARPGVDPIDSAVDALGVFALQMSRPLRHEVLVMLIDSSGCGQSLVTISGTYDPAAVVDIAETMAMATASRTDIDGLVLASVRPGGRITDHDEQLWHSSHDIVAGYAIVLHDWLVVGRHGTASVPTHFGMVPRWPASGLDR